MIVNVSIVSIVKLEAVAGDAVRLLNNRQYEKMMSYYRREDRLRSLGASLLMRKAAHGEQVLYNEAGKPYIPERHFNISHSGDYVVIAEADTAVGVDIEKIGTVEGDWVKAALSPDEYKCMMEKASGDKTAAYWFYLLWTRKESLYKCVGEGFSDFSELPPVLGDRVMFLGLPCRFHSWQEEGHSFSVAVYGPDESVRPSIRTETIPESTR